MQQTKTVLAQALMFSRAAQATWLSWAYSSPSRSVLPIVMHRSSAKLMTRGEP